jgi:hypothetical protein
MRGVMVLLSLAGFFFGAFYNTFHQITGTAVLRAICLIIALAFWYSLTYHTQPTHTGKLNQYLGFGIYLLGAVTAILLFFTRNAFVGEQGNVLYVARMGTGFPYVLYGFFQILATIGNLHNLLGKDGIGLKPQGHYFLLATLVSVGGVVYGILALTILSPAPRVIQDLFAFISVLLMGFSVALHQSVVERRTTFREFVVSGTAMLGISTIYVFGAWLLGMQPEMVAVVVVIAVLTHSGYDLVREFLERIRIRDESKFRRQLRQIESEGTDEESFHNRLQEGVDLLCQTLNTSAGFIAIRRGEAFVVAASRQAISQGSEVPENELSCDDLMQPNSAHLPDITWIAPAFEGKTQVAVVGIGHPNTRLSYSNDDLDLLAEVADRVGTIVSLSNSQASKADRPRQLAAEAPSDAATLSSKADEMMAAMEHSLDLELLKALEDALRHLNDAIALGQSPLVRQAGIHEESHIERGKKLQQLLMDSIEILRPSGPRPHEPLPRIWYNYVVLYDAYVEDLPNYEIMARLYISEGTFNRTRRNALRGLARLIQEKSPAALKA